MYVHIIIVRTYIYRYVPIVGGIGGPLRDKFWADFGAKKLGQKNSDHYILDTNSVVQMSQCAQIDFYFSRDREEFRDKRWEGRTMINLCNSADARVLSRGGARRLD